MTLAALSRLTDIVSRWDRTLFHLVNDQSRNVVFDWLLPALSDKWNFAIPAVLLLLWLTLKAGRRGRLLAAGAILLVLLTDAGAQLAKNLIQRPRPCHTLEAVHLLLACTSSSSFPSNHAANIFALVTLFVYTYRYLLLPAYTLAVLVGYSRIYVGVHYPLDVLAGAMWGSLLAALMIVGSRRVPLFSLETEGEPGTPERKGVTDGDTGTDPPDHPVPRGRVSV